MDFTYFIQNKERIEVAEKPGLYCVAQSHIPKEYFSYRCGLAGRNVDSATQFQTKQGNFASRSSSVQSRIHFPRGLTHLLLSF